MLNQKQIIEYAIKGIDNDIEKLDKAARKGGQMIDAYCKGEAIKTNLQIDEIKKIYRKKKAEIEKLEQAKNELKWQLSELEEQ